MEINEMELPKLGDSFRVVDPSHPLYGRSGQVSCTEKIDGERIIVHTFVVVPMAFDLYDIEVVR